LWNAATGRQEKVLGKEMEPMLPVDFSPDGEILAAGGVESIAVLWNVKSGNKIIELKGHTSRIMDISFNSDGKILASAEIGGKIRLWEIPSGKRSKVLSGRPGNGGLVFSQDGRQLLSTGSDSTVIVWDLASGKQKQVLEDVTGGFFGHEGKLFVGVWSEGESRIRDVGTGNEIDFSGSPSGFMNVSPDLKWIIGGWAVFGPTGLWELETGRLLWRAPAMLPSLKAPPQVFTHQGWLRPGDSSPLVKPEEKRWRSAVEKSIYATATRDGAMLCLDNGDNQLQLWDLGADRVLFTKDVPKIADIVALPSGCIVLSGDRALLFDRSGSSKELSSDAGAVAEVGGEIMVSADSKILVFSPRGEPRSEHESVSDVTALTRVKTTFIVGRKDGAIELVPTVKGEYSFQDTPAAPVVRMIQGPMGTLIAGYKSGFVGIWDIQDGALLDHAWLNGSVKHMMLHDQKLYAATDLGDHLALDLGVFYAEYCDLLRKIWKKVPVVWEGGRPVERKPPDDHQCLAE
jgi:WD40 repeat protein